MWLMQSDNMLQHIPEKIEIQEKEKNPQNSKQTISTPETGRKRKELEFHERNPGMKKWGKY